MKEIQEKEAYLTATNSPNKERRARAIAVGEEARDEAYARFKACEEERGDQIVQAMEQAVTQNAGTCVREMFKILRRACGHSESGGAKLMSMYKDGNRERGETVRGPDLLKEVVKEAILTLEVSSKKPSRAEVEASGNQVHLETNKITTKYLK